MLRGLAVAGMILVNNPGPSDVVLPPLLHAAWNGWHTADLVFPLFLFIVGTSVPLSLSGRAGAEGTRRRVLVRSIALFVIGLALNAFPYFDLDNLRLPGVLQRIAVCYLVAALLFIEGGIVAVAATACVLLAGYAALLLAVPLPDGVAPALSPDANLPAWIDLRLLGHRHLYRPSGDPEGILTTLPAIATTLLGVLVGRSLLATRDARMRAIGTAAAGILALAAGLGASRWLPINKTLWTSSYALFAAGVSALVLGLCIAVIDVARVRRPFAPLLPLGANPIAIYVAATLGSEFLDAFHVTEGGPKLSEWIYAHAMAPWAPPALGSLLYAVVYLCLWWPPAEWLRRRGIFLRV